MATASTPDSSSGKKTVKVRKVKLPDGSIVPVDREGNIYRNGKRVGNIRTLGDTVVGVGSLDDTQKGKQSTPVVKASPVLEPPTGPPPFLTKQRLVVTGTCIVGLFVVLTIVATFSSLMSRNGTVAKANSKANKEATADNKVAIHDPRVKVGYKIPAEGFFQGLLVVDVESKITDKMFALVTFPDGREEDKPIDQAESTLRTHEPVMFNLRDVSHKILPGQYILMIKTKDKTVLHKEEVILSYGKLTVSDATFFQEAVIDPYNFFSGKVEGQRLWKVDILVARQGGTIPVEFNGLTLAIDNDKFEVVKPMFGILNFRPFDTMDNKSFISIRIANDTIFRKEGEKHLIKGRLYYGEKEDCTEFEKEVTIEDDHITTKKGIIPILNLKRR